MYYKIRKIEIRDSKIILTAAPLDLSPVKYQEIEYAPEEQNLQTKLVMFYSDCIEGKLQACGKSKFSSVYKDLEQFRDSIRYTNCIMDKRLDASRREELVHRIARSYASGMHKSDILEMIERCDLDNKTFYDREIRFLKKIGCEFCLCASKSQVFQGQSVYWMEDGSLTIGPSDRCDGKGLVNNQGRVLMKIRIPQDMDLHDTWHYLTSGFGETPSKKDRACVFSLGVINPRLLSLSLYSGQKAFGEALKRGDV